VFGDELVDERVDMSVMVDGYVEGRNSSQRDEYTW
jgi:hypothetical protein